MTTSLTRTTLKGAAWLGGSSFVRLALRMISVGILARLLTPQEYGVVAGSLIALDLAAMVCSLGLAPTLVQRQEVRTDHVASALGFSLAIAVLAAIGMWLAAPAIATLMRMPEVAGVVRALAWLTPLGAFSTICESLLAKEMRSKAIAIRPLLSFFISSFAVAIPLACAGYGYWSLVAMQVAEATISALLLGVAARRFLAWPACSRRAFGELWPMSLGFTLNQPFVYLAANADKFLIGRLIGVEALGLYTRASFISTTAANLFAQVARQSIFPAMAKVQNDRPRLRIGLLRSLYFVAMFALPASALCVIFAEEIIRFLLGSQWNSATIPFSILSTALYFQFTHKSAGTVLLALGNTYKLLLVQVMAVFSVIGGVLIVSDDGLYAMCVAVVIARALTAAATLLLTCETIKVNVRDLLSAHVIPATVAILVVSVSLVIKRLFLAHEAL